MKIQLDMQPNQVLCDELDGSDDCNICKPKYNEYACICDGKEYINGRCAKAESTNMRLAYILSNSG